MEGAKQHGKEEDLDDRSADNAGRSTGSSFQSEERLRVLEAKVEMQWQELRTVTIESYTDLLRIGFKGKQSPEDFNKEIEAIAKEYGNTPLVDMVPRGACTMDVIFKEFDPMNEVARMRDRLKGTGKDKIAFILPPLCLGANPLRSIPAAVGQGILEAWGQTSSDPIQQDAKLKTDRPIAEARTPAFSIQTGELVIARGTYNLEQMTCAVIVRRNFKTGRVNIDGNDVLHAVRAGVSTMFRVVITLTDETLVPRMGFAELQAVKLLRMD